MERFRKYLGMDINLENVSNQQRLEAFGIACRYAPDPPEDFDEFEFGTDFAGQDNIVITVTVELGKIKKIMFGIADAEDPDIIRSLTGPQLNAFLSKKGDQLVGFFDYITG